MSELIETEMSVVQKNVEIMRLRVQNAFLLAALERAESDLDIALERVRVAIEAGRAPDGQQKDQGR